MLISNLDRSCLDDDLLCFFSGDDVSAQQLDDVLQCTLTESKDLKPSLLEFENGEKTCSSSKCSLPEENVTGVSLGDLSPNVKFDTMKEPQVKFIVPEKLTREDKNSFESPSACASGTVVVLSLISL